jgi:TMEM189-like protein
MQATPFFKEATPREILVMRLCVAANVFVISCCALYLVGYFTAAGLSWPFLVVAVLAGYFVADLSSGVVHWGIDTWLDERALGRGIAITREHHTHPDHVHGYGFLEYASLGSAPSAVFFGIAFAVTALFPVSAATYTLMILWFVSSVCLLFGMSFHNLAHRPARSAVMRLAQRLHLVCPPAHHWVHHHNTTIHYCVVNGWANYLCDGLNVWRGLERVIMAVTGRIPRADEAEWLRRLGGSSMLADPQRPAP